MRAWVATLVIGLLLPCSAEAEGPRVILIGVDAEVRRAVHVALEPWGLSIVDVEGPPPSAALPSSTEAARSLALRHDASAVVWMASDGSGNALFVYDREDDWVIARPTTTSPPFDAPRAAAAALTVKTALRHSQVAPPHERRLGTLPERPRQRPRTALALAGGIRLRQTDARLLEGRASLAAAHFPRVFDGMLGFGMLFGTGPGIRVSEASFTGRFLEHVLLATLISRVPIGAFVDLRTLVGAGAQLTSLSGTRLDPTERASALRVNPAISAHVEVGYAIDSLRFALRTGGVVGLRTQTYLVDEANILKVERFAPEVAVVGEITLP